MGEIVTAASSLQFRKNNPSVILACTIKAKGISFAEGKREYHYWRRLEEESARAERELSEDGWQEEIWAGRTSVFWLSLRTTRRAPASGPSGSDSRNVTLSSASWSRG